MKALVYESPGNRSAQSRPMSKIKAPIDAIVNVLMEKRP